MASRNRCFSLSVGGCWAVTARSDAVYGIAQRSAAGHRLNWAWTASWYAVGAGPSVCGDVILDTRTQKLFPYRETHFMQGNRREPRNTRLYEGQTSFSVLRTAPP